MKNLVDMEILQASIWDINWYGDFCWTQIIYQDFCDILHNMRTCKFLNYRQCQFHRILNRTRAFFLSQVNCLRFICIGYCFCLYLYNTVLDCNEGVEATLALEYLVHSNTQLYWSTLNCEVNIGILEKYPQNISVFL